jgi:serine/threonine protein kinase/formylglycine-generating enzyme required for sulfatase activity
MSPNPSDHPDADGTQYSAASGEPQTPGADATSYHMPAAEADSTRYGPAPGTIPGKGAARTRVRRIGEYELLQELGRGGMGVVYKARHLRLNRLVALKVIRSGVSASEQDVQRFLSEARAAARLDHPHIVPIFEIGEAEGLPYFVMALVEGGSLHDRLADGPLPAKEAAALLRMVAEAVQHAHEHGVVHRDLKPHNILLQREESQSGGGSSGSGGGSGVPFGSTPHKAGASGTGTRTAAVRLPKVTDFGVARIAGHEGMTATGEVLGTPSYMPPEQASGRVGEVGPAADVYSLGAVLYNTLTGRPPFQAATAVETLLQVQSQEPLPPRRLNSGVPRDLQTICLRCLQKNPSRRYGTAAELAADLERFLVGEPILARPAGRLERAVKWVKRRPVLAAMWALIVVLTATSGLSITWAYHEAVRERDAAREANQRRIIAQVEQLGTAAPQAVPDLLDALRQDSAVLEPILRQQFENKDRLRQQRVRAGLALMAADPEGVRDTLADWLLDSDDPAEMVVIRDVLAPHGAALRERFWTKVADARDSLLRFRALVALAAFDPDGAGWDEYQALAAEHMLAADPLLIGTWMRALRPVRDRLIEPLAVVYRTSDSPDRREVAATILSDYAADKPEVLARLLLDAGRRRFAVMFPVLRRHAGAAALLLGELKQHPAPDATEAERAALAKQHAGAAAALFQLGNEDAVWPLLRHAPDPTCRSYLVRDLADRGIEAGRLVSRLNREMDVSAKRALILALGEYGPDQLSPEVRQPVAELLLRWYLEHPDAGIHGAIEWLLRHDKEGPEPRKCDWGKTKELERIDRERQGKPAEKRQWYVNVQGQTMVVIPEPPLFAMGSPLEEEGREKDDELETLHSQGIGRSYAIASKPVTVAQFEQFLKEHPDVPRTYRKRYSPDPDGPILDVSWFAAAQYCNWLSAKEGLQTSEWCYPHHAEIKVGMKPYPDYLKRQGYRLPTEAEWEYAARAGATTSRYYGSPEDLLTRYAWYIQNARDRTWPVGQKRPNDLGLFDMHGNVWNWCQEGTRKYGAGSNEKVLEDSEDHADVGSEMPRTLRGGAFNIQPWALRLGYRLGNKPGYRFSGVGFRPARTLLPRRSPDRVERGIRADEPRSGPGQD